MDTQKYTRKGFIMSNYSKISLIPYLLGVVFMLAIGTAVELVKSSYPVIKNSFASLSQKAYRLYSVRFRNSNNGLTAV